MTDIEIAKKFTLKDIREIGKVLGISENDLELYGKYKAKLSPNLLKKERKGKLVLVTAMSPTPLGEGKTTMSIGIADGLRKLGEKAILALREPSLGPVFGIKGGATGGGYSQVAPMVDINLHFTGDIHAMTCANNLIAAILDNHIYQGNELNIDTNKIQFKRCLDMNDRQLRIVRDGIGDKNGVERFDGFDITVASEIMAILCLSTSLEDLKKRIGNILVAYDKDDKAIFVKDLKVEGAIAAVLKDAIKPNLVQTLEGTAAIIHGGPFANIAHGCNSIIATNMALGLGDIVITEAGFGADLGMEKFLDIKCRSLEKKPDVVVIVATVKAIKYHGGVAKTDLANENIPAIDKGIENLFRHVDNVKNIYGLNAIVALNRYDIDSDEEVRHILEECKKRNIDIIEDTSFANGGEGAIEISKEILKLINVKNEFKFAYDLDDDICVKIEKIVKNIYHGKDVEFSEKTLEKIEKIRGTYLNKFPICIAKSQYSFSDDKNLLGAPKDFTFHIKDIRISNGAGFIVCLAGDIMTMPGLPKAPAALNIDVDKDGEIVGIF